jgi:hypothetical protein
MPMLAKAAPFSRCRSATMSVLSVSQKKAPVATGVSACPETRIRVRGR